MSVRVIQGDCREVMATMDACSVDAIVTDPPYGLQFMGSAWDTGAVAFSAELWAEALRVAKPGAQLLAFGGTRTYHRLVCAIEDAGFEIRDSIHWLYGSGFPKSLNLDGEWQGWGTALKPGHEPIVLARKPLAEGTVAANVAAHGTGALNIDACRIHTSGSEAKQYTVKRFKPGATLNATGGNWRPEEGGVMYEGETAAGRWPANVVLSHSAACVLAGHRRIKGSRIDAPSSPTPASGYGGGLNGSRPARGVGDRDGLETVAVWECAPDCPVAELDRQSGTHMSGSGSHVRKTSTSEEYWGQGGGGYRAIGRSAIGYSDQGGASRFFYCAKADRAERDSLWGGVDEGQYEHSGPRGHRLNGDGTPLAASLPRANHHPTVKPVDLMRWLCRLVTPPRGIVLDPFAGSGSTGVACVYEDLSFIGIEQDAAYVRVAEARLTHALGPLFSDEAVAR